MRWKKIAFSSGCELSFLSFLHSNISSLILSRDRTWAAYKILLYGPARKKQRTAGQKKATKSNIASLLNMDGKVSGRSDAYAAVLVCDLTEYIASLY